MANAWKLEQFIEMLLGVTGVALGLSFMMKSGLGQTALTAFLQCISLISGMKSGTLLMCFYLLCVLLQLLIQRKDFDKLQVLQLPVCWIQGIIINLTCYDIAFLADIRPVSYPMQWVFLAVGMILVVLAGIVLAGGGRRIFLAAERLVPLSAGLYTAAALAVIILYAGNVPGVILGILVDAFSFRSAVGGVAGYGISRCVSYGIARGVFSNEAGLGSLAVLNGSAEMASEELQGQWAIFEVFFDTIVSCTLTALVILCVAGSGTASEFGAENGASLTSLCFFTALGSPGGYAVAVCVVLFAFSTIIAWYYMGRQAAEYLGGKISGKIPAVYAVGYLLASFLGCLGAMETVWEVSDIFNGLMAVPNLAALVLLAGEIYAPGEKRDP